LSNLLGQAVPFLRSIIFTSCLSESLDLKTVGWLCSLHAWRFSKLA